MPIKNKVNDKLMLSGILGATLGGMALLNSIGWAILIIGIALTIAVAIRSKK